MTDEDASMKTGPGEWAVADEGERCKAVGAGECFKKFAR